MDEATAKRMEEQGISNEQRFTDLIDRLVKGDESFLEIASKEDIDRYHANDEHIRHVLHNVDDMAPFSEIVIKRMNELLLTMNYFYMISDVKEDEDRGLQENEVGNVPTMVALADKIFIDIHLFLAVFMYGREESGRRWLGRVNRAINSCHDPNDGKGMLAFHDETQIVDILQNMRHAIFYEGSLRNNGIEEIESMEAEIPTEEDATDETQ